MRGTGPSTAQRTSPKYRPRSVIPSQTPGTYTRRGTTERSPPPDFGLAAPIQRLRHVQRNAHPSNRAPILDVDGQSCKSTATARVGVTASSRPGVSPLAGIPGYVRSLSFGYPYRTNTTQAHIAALRRVCRILPFPDATYLPRGSSASPFSSRIPSDWRSTYHSLPS